MCTSDAQKKSAKRFYRDIAAEFQRIKNREKGKVKKSIKDLTFENIESKAKELVSSL